MGEGFIFYIVYILYNMKRKMITIREDQDQWINDNFFNLSKFVQKKLDEKINAKNGG